MAIIPIRGFGQGGFIADQLALSKPINTFDVGRHLRISDNAIGSAGGYETVLNLATVYSGLSGAGNGEPKAVFPWLRATLADSILVIVYDDMLVTWNGTTFTDVTPTAGIADQDAWEYCQYGDVIILTNGDDAPWAMGPTDSEFDTLAGWPASPLLTCKKIIPVQGFLVAIGIVDGGTTQPTRIRWSDLVTPGTSITTDWDFTSTSNLAGLNDIANQHGELLDIVRFENGAALYFEQAVYLMQYAGGNRTFTFRAVVEDEGCVNRRAVVDIGRGHVFAGKSGIFLFTGAGKRPISDARVTKFYQDNIGNERSVQLFHNIRNREVWVMYSGNLDDVLMSSILCWNYLYDAWTPMDLPVQASGTGDIRMINYGPELTEAYTYADADSDSYTYANADTDEFTYTDADPAPGQTFPYVVAVNAAKLYKADTATPTIDGVSIPTLLEITRINFGSVFDEANGHDKVKHVDRVYPIMEGGACMNVRMGKSMTPASPITWGPQQQYLVAETHKADFRTTGRYIGWRMQCEGGEPWRMTELQIRVSLDSER